jgi:Trk-type K+ transport system membrane component
MQLSMASRLKNEYFLQLLGYYLDDCHRVLVYQFASHGPLHDTLHGAFLFFTIIIKLYYFCFFYLPSTSSKINQSEGV